MEMASPQLVSGGNRRRRRWASLTWNLGDELGIGGIPRRLLKRRYHAKRKERRSPDRRTRRYSGGRETAAPFTRGSIFVPQVLNRQLCMMHAFAARDDTRSQFGRPASASARFTFRSRRR